MLFRKRRTRKNAAAVVALPVSSEDVVITSCENIVQDHLTYNCCSRSNYNVGKAAMISQEPQRLVLFLPLLVLLKGNVIVPSRPVNRPVLYAFKALRLQSDHLYIY